MTGHRRTTRRGLLAAAALAPFVLVACATADSDPVVASTSAAPSVSIASTTESTRSSVADSTFMVECVESTVLREPDIFSVSCEDSNSVLEGMRWDGWGEATTRAEGTLVENSCEPSCADGTPLRYPVTVTLSKLEKGEASQFYTELKITYTGKRPEGRPATETHSLTG